MRKLMLVVAVVVGLVCGGSGVARALGVISSLPILDIPPYPGGGLYFAPQTCTAFYGAYGKRENKTNGFFTTRIPAQVIGDDRTLSPFD